MTIAELKNDANFYPYEIPAIVYKWIDEHFSLSNTYCSYIHLVGDTVVIRTFAYRIRKRNGYNLEITEVERKTPELDMAVRKNIFYTTMRGYHPVYEPKACGKSTYYGYYYHQFEGEDFNKWMCEKPMGICSHVINPERIFELDRYQYCGYSGQQDLCDYLRLYNKDPMVEFFGKAKVRASKSLMSKCKKDKGFCRFIKDNAERVNHYGPSIAIYAYDHKIDFKEAEDILTEKRAAERLTKDFYQIRESGVDRVKLYRYIQENRIYQRVYEDYFKAISVLGYDLTDTKNLYPKDFMRMHDLRCDEYAAHKAKLQAKERRKFDKTFKEAAEQYIAYETQGKKYSVVLPRKPKDLVHEGSKLHHCVGKMGYDQKMVEGRSLIVFIRKTEDLTTPYVTVEYLLKEKRVAQVYGDHDSRPKEEVIRFVNKWAEGLTKDLRRQNANT